MAKQKSTDDDGVSLVRSTILNAARPAAEVEDAPRFRLVAGRDVIGQNPGEWEPDEDGLPPDCPVRPLGQDGDVSFFLDPIGSIRALKPPFGKTHIMSLFLGMTDYLEWAWPRFAKGGGIDSFAADAVAAALVRACANRGPWSAVDKIRGRGAWRDAEGALVLHCGTRLLMGGRLRMPGEYEGYVYPTRPEFTLPARRDEKCVENPARALRSILATWSWERPDIDPHLMLGWIGAAFLGGALEWRPAAFLTGDKGTGKSTLQTILKRLFGSWLVQAVDTSAAGIYQHVGTDCAPVAVDEFEAERDVAKQRAVLHLMRQAASGGMMLRGGDRHVGVQFRARNCFLFSSINTPPLPPQDLSRLALLRLKKLEKGAKRPPIDEASMAAMGRLLLRRLLDQWPRFDETLEAFRDELAKSGMDGRAQDTFGTLLACADLLEHDGWDENRLGAMTDSGSVEPWHQRLAPGGMIEFEDQAENWLACLSHLLSVTPEPLRNRSFQTVGQILENYYNITQDVDFNFARKEIARVGLGLVHKEGEPRARWLAVPNQSALARTLFLDTKWQGDPGAGVWSGALRQAENELCEPGRAKINGVTHRVTLLDLNKLYGDGGVMTDGA
ncbi:hypothetical protein JDN40_14390 [Rhodomicrobium vannielii ATCC 17100]|uniref:hypothetical protein n=1 Tax=Rhodomicrobium vannielii TaxID=1069 RepID=UPI001918F5B8|nr:hypothetical protein [Rhodomicrobium vannielii]MBJ7535297.1 hypothetical protein [Rhodomicrobium vannielii ATCC 17100]